MARAFNISSSGVILKNIIFSQCGGSRNGGAVYLSEGANVTFINCTFISNYLHGPEFYGSDIYLDSGSYAYMANCSIFDFKDQLMLISIIR